ncbi:MAG: histidinol-phosphate transaminase [Ginsengibacter sp.]
MNFNLDQLVRKNIKELKPYSSARHESAGDNVTLYLDANENSFGSPLPHLYNRYPDPQQKLVKEALSKIKNTNSDNIFIGNGSDEIIDLSIRIFCVPGVDNIIVCPPTYGMYEVCANINDAQVRKINLQQDFNLDVNGILKAIDEKTKLIFICSPNNPSGNLMKKEDIIQLLKNFNGLVVIDEAYINFSQQKSFIAELDQYPNLLVMQTLSKAWGLASLRLGIGYASAELISLMNKIKPPYNVGGGAQALAAEALENIAQVNEWILQTTKERVRISKEMEELEQVKKVYPSEANFLLVKFKDADKMYAHLIEKKIAVRNRNKEVLCENCLRITIGTPGENDLLIDSIIEMDKVPANNNLQNELS